MTIMFDDIPEFGFTPPVLAGILAQLGETKTAEDLMAYQATAEVTGPVELDVPFSPLFDIRGIRLAGRMVGVRWQSWTGRVGRVTIAETTIAGGDEAAVRHLAVLGDDAGERAATAIYLDHIGVRLGKSSWQEL